MKNNNGMTLIELLISIVLTGLVLTFLFQILSALKDDENRNYAVNNELNRLEIINTIQNDINKNLLTGVKDVSEDTLKIEFYLQNGSKKGIATLSSEYVNEKYYLTYRNFKEEEFKWEIKDAILDLCGDFNYYLDQNINKYYFRLNLYVYDDNNLKENNKLIDDNNPKENNNLIDDIEISYSGIDKLRKNDNDLTNKISGNKIVGKCTN